MRDLVEFDLTCGGARAPSKALPVPPVNPPASPALSALSFSSSSEGNRGRSSSEGSTSTVATLASVADNEEADSPSEDLYRADAVAKLPWLQQSNGQDHYVCEPAASLFEVRSASYLNDRVKQPSQPPLLPLLGVDLFAHPSGISDPARSMFDIEGSTAHRTLHEANASLTVHFQVPTEPPHSLAITFGTHDAAPVPEALRFLLECSAEDRANRFKLIPAVREGPWLVKKGVGSSPCIIGRQIQCKWVDPRPGHVECSVDVGSDALARAILSLISGATRHLVIDLAFLVEAVHQPELPERLLGCVRLGRLDLAQATVLQC